MQIVFFRAFFSAVVLAILILFKNKNLFKVKLKDLWLFISAGIFSIVLFNFSYYKTMALTSLSVAAVLLYTAPIFVCVLSVILFREKVTFNKLFALLIAFVGCCFVSGAFSKGQTISVIALVFGLLTGFGYSLYTIFSQLLINKKYNTLTITFYTFLFAAVGSLVFVNTHKTYLKSHKKPRKHSEALKLIYQSIQFFVNSPYSIVNSGSRKVTKQCGLCFVFSFCQTIKYFFFFFG